VANAYASNSDAADPDLAFVVDAWPSLPDGVRQSIMMLVKAARS